MPHRQTLVIAGDSPSNQDVHSVLVVAFQRHLRPVHRARQGQNTNQGVDVFKGPDGRFPDALQCIRVDVHEVKVLRGVHMVLPGHFVIA